ncbi:MAG TPA: hypothetical protein VMG11_07955 [Steroidobacteraceae bacterium]|nr:hypothetical protein [Steroidobacteraceae bacterium]
MPVRRLIWVIGLLGASLWRIALGAAAEDSIPSRPGIDAPELALPGPNAVGYRTLELRQPDQIDVLRYDAAKATFPHVTRALKVDLWYPAVAQQGARPMLYEGALPSEPGMPDAHFTVSGLATRDATPEPGAGRGLVIVSHGYSNVTAALTWLTENLASKGYVVAAIRHEDPPLTDRTKTSEPAMRRPLDIAFVADELRRRARAGDSLLAGADADRIALIGYSMGGYGVLTAAGAPLSATSPVVSSVPGGALRAYAGGEPRAAELVVPGVKAVVAISPLGGAARLSVWGAAGLAQLRVPLLLIVGDHDQSVGYRDGVRTIFEQAIHAPRYLLVYENAGHSIGLNPAPPSMRERLWDLDWFADPVWRTAHVNAVNLHFITALLDRYVKGEQDRAAYLDSSVVEGSEGTWPEDLTRYDAYSPGGAGRVWKGFHRRHAAGLQLYHAVPAP